MDKDKAREPNVPWGTIAALCILAYAVQVHGWWIGVAVGAAAAGMLIIGSFWALSRDTDADPLRMVHRMRWIVWIAFMVGIALSGVASS